MSERFFRTAADAQFLDYADDNRAQALALARRIHRKAEAMTAETVGRQISSTEVRRDAEEIRILAKMIEQRLGGEHA